MRKFMVLGFALAFSLVIISSLTAEEKIDLNTATADQINTLQGVSQETARAIVAERNAAGPYLSAADCSRRVQGLSHAATAKWDSVTCSLPPAKADMPTSGPLSDKLEGMIDLNTASAAQIQSLQGVSQETAKAIVAERNAAGPYLSAADCSRRVQGLSHATTAKWDSAKCSLPPAKPDHPTSEHPK